MLTAEKVKEKAETYQRQQLQKSTSFLEMREATKADIFRLRFKPKQKGL